MICSDVGMTLKPCINLMYGTKLFERQSGETVGLGVSADAEITAKLTISLITP